jgi:hypothetical protein
LNDLEKRKLIRDFSFRRDADEIFWDFLTLEDGTDTLCRNVGKGLPPTLHYNPEERRKLIISLTALTGWAS